MAKFLSLLCLCNIIVKKLQKYRQLTNENAFQMTKIILLSKIKLLIKKTIRSCQCNMNKDVYPSEKFIQKLVNCQKPKFVYNDLIKKNCPLSIAKVFEMGKKFRY